MEDGEIRGGLTIRKSIMGKENATVWEMTDEELKAGVSGESGISAVPASC